MNTNSGKKVKFNWLDVLIIIFIAAVIFVGYKYFAKTSANSGNASKISYVIELPNKDKDYQKQIKVGDEIKDGIKGGFYGTVTDVRYMPAKIVNEDVKNGKYVESSVPERYDYYITVEGIPTTYTDSKIMFASQDIRVGNEIYIRSKNYAGEGYVVDIDFGD